MPLFVIVLYLLSTFVVYGYRWIPENRLETYNDIIITLVCSITSLILFQVYRRFDRSDAARYCWLFFGIGVGCEAVGYLIYSIMEFSLNRHVEFPNIAEIPIAIGWILYIYSFYFYKSLLSVHSIHPPLSRKIVVNSFFIFLIILHCVFYALPTLLDPSQSMGMRLIFQIYPTMNLILAYFCLHLALAWRTAGQSAIALPWMILVAAFFVFLLTNYIYHILVLWGLYHPYQWINPGWGLAYLLISHAALRQKKLMNDYNIDREDDFLLADDSSID